MRKALFRRKKVRVAVLIALVLLSAGLGYSLICGAGYEKCATVVLLLFILFMKGTKKHEF